MVVPTLNSHSTSEQKVDVTGIRVFPVGKLRRRVRRPAAAGGMRTTALASLALAVVWVAAAYRLHQVG